jgi:polysaccharide pyruvyl transferase WcaK-like protein
MIFSTHFSKPSDKITQSLTETLEIYPELDFVIGMRLHSLILATVHAIPFLALSYETKTQELLHDLAYDYMLNVKKGDFVDFQRKFSDLEKQAKEVKFAL